jgi:hypothetical protein
MMMVNDDDIDTAFLKFRYRINSRNSRIDRDQEPDALCYPLIGDGGTQSVSIMHAVRQSYSRLYAAAAEVPHHLRGSRDAVAVIIAEDADALLARQGICNTLYCPLQIGRAWEGGRCLLKAPRCREVPYQ